MKEVEGLEPNKILKIHQIISGGQCGVDRAALDVAIALKLKYGGFCPGGRRAEDGIIPTKYRLIETKSKEYAERTLKNVQIADGTLILHKRELAGGTVLTREYCHQEGSPLLILNIGDELLANTIKFREWIHTHAISILNVAGPRESEAKIYQQARIVISRLLRSL